MAYKVVGYDYCLIVEASGDAIYVNTQVSARGYVINVYSYACP